MAQQQQIERTPATIYGEVMRDSGITLPNGFWIAGADLVSELMIGGLQNRTLLQQQFLNDYGFDDNRWTRVQLVQPDYISRGHGPHVDLTYFSKYTFNPWKELMGGAGQLDSFGLIYFYMPKKIVEALRTMQKNPREGTDRMKDVIVLFTKIPKSLQEEFLGLVDTYPCDISNAIHQPPYHDPTITHPHIHDVVSRILQETREDNKPDTKYVLELFGRHNICVRKGTIIRDQLEDFLGFDTTAIPTTWEEGHLDQRVVAEKREEMTELLKKFNKIDKW